MRILVTGATGYVGSRLVTALVADGHEVLTATREPARLERMGWFDDVTPVALDASDAESVHEAFAAAGQVDVVYYLVHAIGQPGFRDADRAAAEQVIAGTKDIIARVKARGMKIIGATIVPRHSIVAGRDTGWNDAMTKIRNQVNDWIRKGTDFDAVIDFDRVVRSAKDPDLLEPAYNCGDGIHPSSIGYFQMGKSVDLGLFGLR